MCVCVWLSVYKCLALNEPEIYFQVFLLSLPFAVIVVVVVLVLSISFQFNCSWVSNAVMLLQKYYFTINEWTNERTNEHLMAANRISFYNVANITIFIEIFFLSLSLSPTLFSLKEEKLKKNNKTFKFNKTNDLYKREHEEKPGKWNKILFFNKLTRALQ